MKRPLRLLVGLVLLLATLALVEWQLGWGPVLRAWTALPPELLLPASGGILLSYACKAGRMAHAFRKQTRNQYLAVARISQLHNLAVALVPMRAGEAAFPLLMKRHFGLGLVETTASLAWFRALDLILLVSIPLGVHLAVLHPVLFMGFAVLVAVKIGLSPTLVRWFFRQLPTRGRLGRLAVRIRRGMPRERGDYWAAWAWTFGIWGCKFLALILLYMGFAGVSAEAASAAILGGELAAILPIQGLAGAGTYEAGAAAGLAPYGVTLSQALAAAVNVHLFMLAAAVLTALPFLLIPARHDA